MVGAVLASEFKFFGGRVCLDFANTLNWRLTGTPVELVPDYARLLDWSEGRGTLSRHAAARLRRLAVIQPAEAAEVMAGARDLRADLIRTGDALRWGHRPDIAALNRALSGLPSQPDLVRDDGRFVFDLNGTDLRQPMWPVVWSMTAVLASGDAGRIGSCQADGCGWFFVDESPSRARLWCCDACGNRERVRRSYAKRRSRQG